MPGLRRNIELKAVVRDPAHTRETAAGLGAVGGGVLRQTDTYFPVPVGRLKLRQAGEDRAELIAYQRPDVSGQRESSYRIIEVFDGDALRALLSETLGVAIVVSKRRELFFYENVRIHLDEVEQLGWFIEFEAVMADGADEAVERQKLDCLVAAFDIRPGDVVAVGYRELLLNLTGPPGHEGSSVGEGPGRRAR